MNNTINQLEDFLAEYDSWKELTDGIQCMVLESENNVIKLLLSTQDQENKPLDDEIKKALASKSGLDFELSEWQLTDTGDVVCFCNSI